jgi:hypothetical protein
MFEEGQRLHLLDFDTLFVVQRSGLYRRSSGFPDFGATANYPSGDSVITMGICTRGT